MEIETGTFGTDAWSREPVYLSSWGFDEGIGVSRGVGIDPNDVRLSSMMIV